MRLKIDGPITLDRLEEALNEARRLLDNPEARFYGANIYVNAFDVAGQKILPICDNNREPDVYIAAPANDQKRPQVAEVVLKAAMAERQQEEEKQRAARAEEQRKQREQKRKSAENRARLHQTLESSKSAFSGAVSLFNSMLTTLGPTQIALELNAQISIVWKENGLMGADGTGTREVRPQPYFVALEDRVVLRRGGQANSVIKLDVPFGHINSKGEAKLHWRYPEWSLAVVRMKKRLNDIAVTHNLSLFQIKLGKIIVSDGYTSEDMLVWLT